MKQMILRLTLLLGVSVLIANASLCQTKEEKAPLKIIILRHAEKPDKGDNLSCEGFNRALALSNVLYSKFKLPDYIFVPSINTGKTTGTARMYQTIVPFAVKYNLKIDTKFDVGKEKALCQSILKKSGTVLVVWEHNNIPAIAQELGVTGGDKKLKWKGSDFDTIWIITFKDGKAELSTDKENINPSNDCK